MGKCGYRLCKAIPVSIYSYKNINLILIIPVIKNIVMGCGKALKMSMLAKVNSNSGQLFFDSFCYFLYGFLMRVCNNFRI